jgi:hypothetical protein
VLDTRLEHSELVGACYYFGRAAFTHSKNSRARMQDRMKIPSILIAIYAVLGAVAVTVAAQYPQL